jgi:gas vesicle protein
MSQNNNTLLTALVAFAGGVLAGMLLAPQSGQESRRYLARQARQQARRAEEQWHRVEAKLSAVEQQVEHLGHQVGDRLREAGAQAVEQVRPAFPENPDEWKVKAAEMTQDLPRMPHG